MSRPFKIQNISSVAKMYNDGLSPRQIGNKLKLSPNTIRRTLQINGYALRNLSQSKKGHKRPNMSGENHPNWKGDNCQPNNGRQRARKMYSCPKGYEIHHIDGNPLNNNPENIAIVTHQQHIEMDGRKQMWPEWRKRGGPTSEESKKKLSVFAKSRPKIRGKFTKLNHLEKPKMNVTGETFRELLDKVQTEHKEKPKETQPKGDGCVNPHEKIYRGCSIKCEEFGHCNNPDALKVKETQQ